MFLEELRTLTRKTDYRKTDYRKLTKLMIFYYKAMDSYRLAIGHVEVRSDR